MTCERTEEHLSELIDNELDPQTTKEISEHLENCASCREKFEEFRLIVRQSAALPPMEPPDRLYWTIRNKARSSVAGHDRPWFARQKIGWLLIPALATAALMLVLFPKTHSSGRPGTEAYSNSAPAHIDSSAPLAVIPEAPQPAASESGIRDPKSAVAAKARTAGEPAARSPQSEIVQAVQPIAAVEPVQPQTNSEVIASLRNIQQALEEIEGALQQNPGNVQVQVAYRVTYQKGMELRQRYVLRAR